MTDLESVFTTLFTAPTKAVVEAEARYREIWAQWLRDLKGLIAARKAALGQDLSDQEQEKLITAQLNQAPAMRLDGKIEVGVTMRLASVTKTEGDVSLGVGVGAFQVSGSFGFSSQTTQESVLQARAIYGITNSREMSLGDYLKSFSIPITNADSLDKAVAFLAKPENKPAKTN